MDTDVKLSRYISTHFEEVDVQHWTWERITPPAYKNLDGHPQGLVSLDTHNRARDVSYLHINHCHQNCTRILPTSHKMVRLLWLSGLVAALAQAQEMKYATVQFNTAPRILDSSNNSTLADLGEGDMARLVQALEAHWSAIHHHTLGEQL